MILVPSQLSVFLAESSDVAEQRPASLLRAAPAPDSQALSTNKRPFSAGTLGRFIH